MTSTVLVLELTDGDPIVMIPAVVVAGEDETSRTRAVQDEKVKSFASKVITASEFPSWTVLLLEPEKLSAIFDTVVQSIGR